MGKGGIFQRKRLRVVNLRPNDAHSPEFVTICPFARFQLNAEVLVAATSLPTNGPERERLGLGLGSSHHHGDQSSLGRSRDGRFPGVWRGRSWSGSHLHLSCPNGKAESPGQRINLSGGEALTGPRKEKVRQELAPPPFTKVTAAEVSQWGSKASSPTPPHQKPDRRRGRGGGATRLQSHGCLFIA